MIGRDVLGSIENMWISRAKAQEYKHGSAAYNKAEVEFFAGAMASLTAYSGVDVVPPAWVIMVMSGRNIVEKKRYEGYGV